MSVWVLLLVFLAPVNGGESTYFLNKFDSPTAYEDCMTSRTSIAADMEKTYPGDKSYTIECREKPSESALRAEYDEMIKNFASARYPKQKLTIKVLNLKPIVNETGTLPIMALQIHVTHKDGNQSFIMFIKDKTILGWIDAGEVDAEEEDTDTEEEFPGKEFA